MSSDLIERAKKALQGATPGPWEAFWPVNLEHPWINAACNHSQASDGREYYMSVSGLCQVDDAHLIALAPDLARLAVAAGEAIGALEGIMTAMEGLGHGPFDNERAALARFRAIAEGRE